MKPSLRISARGADVSDDDLVVEVGSGKLDALGSLYDRHAADVARLASRLGAGADTEDIVHAVFLRVVDIAPRYVSGGAPVRAWLAGITVCVVRERRRSLGRWLRALSGVGREPDRTASPETQRSDVHAALATLSTAHRETLVLVDGAGFTAAEAGDVLGVAQGTVWSRLHHGRAAIRAYLGDDR